VEDKAVELSNVNLEEIKDSLAQEKEEKSEKPDGIEATGQDLFVNFDKIKSDQFDSLD
jgi:hypothetical protein